MAESLGADLDAGERFKRAVEWLTKAGVTLGPCGLQGLLLAICIALVVAAAVGAISSKGKIKKSSWRNILIAILSAGGFVPAAVAVTIIWVWVTHLLHPLEGLIEGRVTTAPHTGLVALSLVDASGQELGTADADASGAFDLPYRGCFCDEPNQIIIKINGCKDESHTLNRDDILGHSRGRQELEVHTKCEPL
jgi:hypothetical protein